MKKVMFLTFKSSYTHFLNLIQSINMEVPVNVSEKSTTFQAGWTKARFHLHAVSHFVWLEVQISGTSSAACFVNMFLKEIRLKLHVHRYQYCCVSRECSRDGTKAPCSTVPILLRGSWRFMRYYWNTMFFCTIYAAWVVNVQEILLEPHVHWYKSCSVSREFLRGTAYTYEVQTYETVFPSLELLCSPHKAVQGDFSCGKNWSWKLKLNNDRK